MTNNYIGHSNQYGVYSVKDDLLSNVSPFVNFVGRCMIHDECAGFISRGEANEATAQTESYCRGCGWDGTEDSTLILQYGLHWRSIFASKPPVEATKPTGSPIEHPGWREANTPRNKRDLLRCMACGTKTRKRWSIDDGHEWSFNGNPIIGDLVRILCSVRCAKDLHPDRVKSKWKITEITGLRF